MLLQIHESIGHALEVDRILGDERNYADGFFNLEDLEILNMVRSYEHNAIQHCQKNLHRTDMMTVVKKLQRIYHKRWLVTRGLEV